MSLGIVEAHGGTLTVDCPPERRRRVHDRAARRRGRGRRRRRACRRAGRARASAAILVVDDEAEIRDTLAEILTGARHRVVAVGSGAKRCSAWPSERYDVIFTDMRMPDLDGRALYREIEQRWPDQAGRVVFVTGDTLTAGLREFVSESGRPVIEKPFLPSDVRRVVVDLAAD